MQTLHFSMNLIDTQKNKIENLAETFGKKEQKINMVKQDISAEVLTEIACLC